ncbi:MAG: tyrosine-type recombinase/integrase [Actinobacteria bacterium]|nr:tyrosine-type recombinase/integrase [Actinomycetota bacterium]
MAHIIKVDRKTTDGKKRHAWKVRYRDPDRVERSKTFAKKSEAEDFAATIETEILRGDYIDPRAGKVKLEDWAAKWLTTITVKPKTKAQYEGSLRSRILPIFGKRQLAGIRRSDIQAWIAGMNDEGLSASRIHQCLVVLRQLLDAAVDDRLIARNPAERIKRPKIPYKEAAYFDPATADQIVANIDEPYRLLFRILAITGLRWGEAVALRRRHVDLLRRRLRVEDSLAEVKGKFIFGSTKTHAVRGVPLSPALLAELKEHLERADKNPDDLLFTGEKGGPLRYRYGYMDLWRATLKELGLPMVGIHALRHSAAARMISAGASPKAVQSIMGHRSAAFTLTVYGHMFDEDLDALARRLDTQTRNETA